MVATGWGVPPGVPYKDWDSPKGDVSQFERMSQDHTNYNMSLISVQVKGITDLEALAEVT